MRRPLVMLMLAAVVVLVVGPGCGRRYSLPPNWDEIGASVEAGNWQTTASLARDWDRFDPGSPGATYLALVAYDRLGRFDIGYRTYLAALGRAPMPSSLQIWAGSCGHGLTRDHPDSRRALQVRAAMYAEVGRPTRATEWAGKAIDLSPWDPASWVVRGDAYRLDRAYDLAIKDYTHALGLDPKSLSARCGRGLVYEAQRMEGAAEKDFKEAERLAPGVAQKVIEAKRDDMKRLTEKL